MTVITQFAQLPIAPPQKLAGRNALLNDIHSALSPQQPILLYGASGIGKHALAATLAAERLKAFGQVLWLKAANPQTLASQVMRAYGYSPSVSTSAIQELLMAHQPLVIITELSNHLAAAHFVAQYTQGRAATLVLHDTAADGPWEPLLVRRLNLDAAFQLLMHHLGLLEGMFPQTDPNIETLLTLLDGHPLSIELVGRQIGQNLITVPEILMRLPQESHEAIEKQLLLLGVTFDLLDPMMQGLLLAMGANFGRGISSDLLGRVLGTSVDHLCQHLIERGFIARRGGDTALFYAIHPLIQRFAIEKLTDNQQLDSAQKRMLDAIHAYVIAYADADPAGTHPILLEIDNILRGAQFSYESGRYDILGGMMDALGSIQSLLETWGYAPEYAHLATLQERIRRAEHVTPNMDTRELILDDLPEDIQAKINELAPDIIAEDSPVPHETEIIEGNADDDEVIEAEFVQELDDTQPTRPANLDMVLQQRETTLTTYAQNLQLELRDAEIRQELPQIARLNSLLGEDFAERGFNEYAVFHFEAALQTYQDIGDLSNVLHSLEQLTLYGVSVKGINETLNYVRRGLNIARQLGDDAARRRFLVTIGDLRGSQGDSASAMEAYKRAIKLGRMLKDDEATGITLAKLATLYMDSEQYRDAISALSQSIKLFEPLGRHDLVGRSLGNMGTALGSLGRWREAGQRHAAALKIARDLGDIEEEGFQLRNLAFVAETEGHLKWAVNYLRQALYLALVERKNRLISEITFDLGRILLSDSLAIGQAVILLERSAKYNPHAETNRLLKSAQIRLERHRRSRQPLDPVEDDLYAYAAAVYPHDNNA